MLPAAEDKTEDVPPREAERQQLHEALRRPQPGLLREFVDFLRSNKKWWLIPLLVTLFLIAAFVFVAMSPVAPLVYPF